MPRNVLNRSRDVAWRRLQAIVIGAALALVVLAAQAQYSAPPTCQVQFAYSESSVSEGDGVAQIKVSLTAASAQTVTVNYATSDDTGLNGVDYTTATGTLTFNPGEI